MKTIKLKQGAGFTLIEIMVSLAISSLVIGGIYGVYAIQQKSYTVQEQVTELQQKIRSALDFMSRDMRLANYNPKPPYDNDGSCDDVTMLSADAVSFSFEYCKVEKLGSTYTSEKLTSAFLLYDANSDGTIDLGAEHNGEKKSIADGVDAIEFRYFDAEGKILPTPVAVGKICSVQVSMLVRASYPDPRHTDTILYKPASVLEAERKGLTASVWDINGTKSGTGNPANDHYHRRLLITSIQLRNNI